MNNFYEVLSLPRNVTSAEIKERFRELARERHPDRFQGEAKVRAEHEFQEITQAFNVLMDPSRRRQHDLELDRPTSQAQDPAQLARVFLNRGIRAYKKGDYLDAANNFDRATQTTPGNSQAWHHLALTCVQVERWLPKAREAIERAMTLEPGKPTYLKLAGKIFADSGMTARAKEYYNQALRLGGPDAGTRKALEALEKPAAEQREAERSSLFRKIW